MHFKNRQIKASRKWIAAIMAIATTILFVCVAVSALAGGITWLFGQDEKSQLIRISALAPLTTPKPTSSLSPTQEPDTTAKTTALPSDSTPVSLPENQPAPAPETQNATTPLPPATILAGYAAPVTRLVIPRLNLNVRRQGQDLAPFRLFEPFQQGC